VSQGCVPVPANQREAITPSNTMTHLPRMQQPAKNLI
jgi:hypothetical protein